MLEGPPMLRREARSSLAARIRVFVFGATCATALVVSAIALHATYSDLRGDLEARFPAVLDQSTSRVQRVLHQSRVEVELAATSRTLDRCLRSRSRCAAARAELEGLLAPEARASGLFRALWLVGREAEVRASAGPGPLLREAPGSELSKPPAATLRGFDAGEFVAPLASAPLAGGLGTLHALLDPARLALELESDSLGLEGNALLVGADGRILGAARGSTQERSAVLSRDLLERDDPGRIRSSRDADGARTLASIRWLAPHPLRSDAEDAKTREWAVIVQQPLRAAFAPLLTVLVRLLVADVAIVVLFTFLAYEITHTILRPIEALYAGARRISEGELDVEVPLPETRDEIGLLTLTFNDMARRLAKNRSEIEAAYGRAQEQNDELQRANEVLAQLSITDGLTKLHNHRYFQDHLTREIKRAARSGEPLAILLIDIDDFKRLNDRLGHAAGDELLVRIAQVLNECVRETDLLARYGGEEFVVLATGTDLDGAVRLAEKIRTAVAEASFILDDSLRPSRATVSIGVATYSDSRRDFFQSADRALYRAKAEGKNCVMTEEDPGV